MTIRNVLLQNSGMVDTCLPARGRRRQACQPHGYWQRRDAASQRMLARVMRENRVKDECLIIARKALEHFLARRDNYASNALAEIWQRLAQLETEEETE